MAASVASGGSAMGTEPRRVLIADDEPLARELLRALLAAQPGVEVVGEAVDGGEAVHACLERRPDLVLLDISMPGIDGLETLRRIKAINPDAEIIMLTGHGSVQSGVEAMKLGAGDFLQKPVELSELMARIGEARDKRMLVLQKRSQEELRKILQAKSW